MCACCSFRVISHCMGQLQRCLEGTWCCCRSRRLPVLPAVLGGGPGSAQWKSVSDSGCGAWRQCVVWGCRQDLKELKFRPSTDVHDYQVRLRAAQKFIAKVRLPWALA